MADDTAATLDSLMGAYYKAVNLSQGTPQAAYVAFDNAVALDPALEPLARTTLAELKKINPKRCVITATKVDFLTKALDH